ncbi:class I SAM-dependent methyltransferase [Adhaeribacter soli]|uniref:Class I SAM-dependent methyltransferase n=1 Tax=Adhaeribacter soli TaxID=2607655 RepID=A0A5N1ILS3_9BACT|nr:class I SAM-dependent methyltransferase [Adhaeribacter soli]KAA9327298.1 class I SAM-dependent methyltransferase [Adhaeribacter soli]
MQNNFNRIAPFYDFLARRIFGKAIQNSQTWLLPFVPENANVLIIGGGTGWILTEFLKHTNCRSILYLEASGKMLELSKKRYDKAQKTTTDVAFRLGTETVLKPEETFDVVFTGFLFDLFQPEPLHDLMTRLNAHLKPGGSWLVADFEPKNATSFWQKSLLKSMILFFKLTANLQANELPDLEKEFAHFPLNLQQQKFFYKKLIAAGVYRKQ